MELLVENYASPVWYTGLSIRDFYNKPWISIPNPIMDFNKELNKMRLFYFPITGIVTWSPFQPNPVQVNE